MLIPIAVLPSFSCAPPSSFLFWDIYIRYIRVNFSFFLHYLLFHISPTLYSRCRWAFSQFCMKFFSTVNERGLLTDVVNDSSAHSFMTTSLMDAKGVELYRWTAIAEWNIKNVIFCPFPSSACLLITWNWKWVNFSLITIRNLWVWDTLDTSCTSVEVIESQYAQQTANKKFYRLNIRVVVAARTHWTINISLEASEWGKLSAAYRGQNGVTEGVR